MLTGTLDVADQIKLSRLQLRNEGSEFGNQDFIVISKAMNRGSEKNYRLNGKSAGYKKNVDPLRFEFNRRKRLFRELPD